MGRQRCRLVVAGRIRLAVGKGSWLRDTGGRRGPRDPRPVCACRQRQIPRRRRSRCGGTSDERRASPLPLHSLLRTRRFRQVARGRFAQLNQHVEGTVDGGTRTAICVHSSSIEMNAYVPRDPSPWRVANDFLRPRSRFRSSGGFRSRSRVPAVGVSARAARGSRRGRGRVRSVPGSPAR
jgi:hypothetical protein